MSNWAPDFLDMSEAQHAITSPRLEGEASLADLARMSEVEYAWEYDDTTQQWRYFPGKSFSAVTYQDGLVSGVQNGLTVDPALHYPIGHSSTFYHIHPLQDIAKIEVKDFAASLPVQAQIPSSEDIEACVKLTLNGYKDIRIVTALGVTS